MLREVAATGVGAAVGSSFIPSALSASEKTAAAPGKPRRVIFFLQNNGFHANTCIPLGMKQSGSLSGAKLPQSIKPLESYLDKITIVNGLHGLHILWWKKNSSS